MTKKKTESDSNTETPALGSKGDFVRSMPAGTPVKEVIAKAKEAGITLTDGYVYKLRGAAKKPSKKNGKGKFDARTNAASTKFAKRTVAVSARKPAGEPVNTVKVTADDPHERAILEAMQVLGVARSRSVIESAARFFPA